MSTGYPPGAEALVPGEDAVQVLREIEGEIGRSDSHTCTMLVYRLKGDERIWATLTYYQGPGSGRQHADPEKRRTARWVTVEGFGATSAEAVRAAWDGQPDDDSEAPNA